MRRASWMWGLALGGWMGGAAIAALGVACGSSSSNGGSGGTGGTGGTSGSTDGGADGKADGNVDSGPTGLVCAKLLTCDQPCTSDACTNACYAEATAVAQGLFDALTDCIAATCPSTAGGPCVDGSSSACSSCQTGAATGACVSKLFACEQDTAVGPADPDGGSVAVPEAGSTYSCGELTACLTTCPGDGGASCTATCNALATPQAIALEAALNDCLAAACPSTDGGPCATPGLACNGCIEQVELADPNTCAAPYVACNSDTSNTDAGPPVATAHVDGGVLSTILTGLNQAASTIVVSNGYLYFTQVVGGGPVYRLWVGGGEAALGDGGLAFGDGGALSPDGGPLLSSVGPPQPTPVSLAVDANNVYVWSVGTFGLSSSTNNHDGTVVQIPLGGGAPVTLGQNLEVFYDAAYLNAVAVDSQYVYWVAGATGNDGTIMRAPIGGGGATAIYSGQYLPQAVVTDGTNVYWADWGTFDSMGRSNNDGTLWQGSINGGTAVKLASNQAAPSSIAVDTQNVFWVNLGNLGAANFPAMNTGSVMKTPIGGGTLTTVAPAQAVPVSILVSGGTLFWSEYGLNVPGVIMSTPTAGGALIPLATGLNDPAALAISGNTIYWTDANSSPTNGFIQSLSPF